ncbi:amino acid ABC transporter substrate-binding protein, PAAT family [Rosenbergiella nectarea]|uniref:Amino acid ABC transporter substrate-binding protein, PAAT family n=1 Tax=Rosenbergiella nectarea TaxID=988801 RepID=A0A1H9EYT1_9GAMM|nr:transporter substrate-binding domain-containing protein [Rosenbergiella nectarea]SEQ30148.1 amino acid ABC transporter substrate-binding protein, PAAT family [Rosenbergiella nectarea]
MRYTSLASLLLLFAVHTQAAVDLKANETPLNTPVDPKAIALLPAHYRLAHAGQLTVAVSAQNSPPLSLVASDNRTRIGSDIDIARLLAQSLGLPLNIVPVSWEEWPLGLSSGRYDVALVNIAVTEPRKQKYDFATYRTDSLAFSVKHDSPITHIATAKDIAGQRVIVGSGTNQERILLDWNAQLRQQHLKPAIPIYLTDDATTTLFLQSGRAEVNFGPQAAAAWKAALNGRTKVVGNSPYKAWVATTTLKGNGLVKALNQALNDAIASGHYQKILSRWGEAQEGVAYSQSNPPGITYR